MTRATSELTRNGLKTAFKQALDGLGGLDAAASCTRVTRSKLQEYGSVVNQDRHVPVDVVLDLELILGQPLVTQTLARLQGYVLVPVALPGEGDVQAALQRVAEDAGKTLSDAMRALGTGMAAAELATLQSDLTEMNAATGAALALVNSRLGLRAAGDQVRGVPLKSV